MERFAVHRLIPKLQNEVLRLDGAEAVQLLQQRDFALALGDVGFEFGGHARALAACSARRQRSAAPTLIGCSARISFVVGTLRIAEGQLQKKVNDGFPYMRRWVAVQRLVWEAANGPIPPGHIVVFKDGRIRTEEAQITLGVLELISRGENMRRNSVHTRYPKEVALLVQLRGAINRQINKRAKA